MSSLGNLYAIISQRRYWKKYYTLVTTETPYIWKNEAFRDLGLWEFGPLGEVWVTLLRPNLFFMGIFAILAILQVNIYNFFSLKRVVISCFEMFHTVF